MPRPDFHPLQATELGRAFQDEGVEYLFIGKGAALLLGYPGTTQDVDVFPARTADNGRRIVAALRKIGFNLHDQLEQDIVAGKDFVQIKDGPFDVDLVFAPDGIASFAEARARSLLVEGIHVANLRDIIASKRASGREKDLLDLEYLERFRQEYEKAHSPPLRSVEDIVKKNANQKRKSK